jgi:hypothetical protein
MRLDDHTVGGDSSAAKANLRSIKPLLKQQELHHGLLSNSNQRSFGWIGI